MEGLKDKATKMRNKSPGGTLEESSVPQKGIHGFMRASQAQALFRVHSPWDIRGQRSSSKGKTEGT